MAVHSPDKWECPAPAEPRGVLPGYVFSAELRSISSFGVGDITHGLMSAL